MMPIYTLRCYSMADYKNENFFDTKYKVFFFNLSKLSTFKLTDTSQTYTDFKVHRATYLLQMVCKSGLFTYECSSCFLSHIPTLVRVPYIRKHAVKHQREPATWEHIDHINFPYRRTKPLNCLSKKRFSSRLALTLTDIT